MPTADCLLPADGYWLESERQRCQISPLNRPCRPMRDLPFALSPFRIVDAERQAQDRRPGGWAANTAAASAAEDTRHGTSYADSRR